MAALIQFVDSISATPTVRLDLNDALSWFCQNFKAPPPRLRRNVSDNSMRDGGRVGSSTYENRTLELELVLVEDVSEEWAAEEMQKLWRELDRADNWLMYHPEWLEKPVFFRTFRSDVSDLEELWTYPIARRITIELLAEPFALGLKETLGPYTVSADPAAPSNPGYVDLPTILGDVPVPAVYWDNTTVTTSRLVATHAGPTGPVPFVQCETMTPGVNTTNPGGGPDAAMSGTGTNNYLQTTFGTPADSLRVTSAGITQPGGAYRVLLYVRRSSSVGAVTVRATLSETSSGAPIYWTSATESTAATSNRQVVDLGICWWPSAAPVGNGATSLSVATIKLYAARGSGTSNLDWDSVRFVPAGGQVGRKAGSHALVAPGSAVVARAVLDGVSETSSAAASSSDPTTTSIALEPIPMAGSFPVVAPGVANRIHALTHLADNVAPIGTTLTATLAYWPGYIFVRPELS